MNAQTTENDFVAAFRNTLTWLLKTMETNPFVIYNPIRPIVVRYNSMRMNRFLNRVMDERFAARSQNGAAGSKERTRPVIDLALDAYINGKGAQGVKDKADTSGAGKGLDPAFKTAALDHIKVFMFGGHDTTSSTICYVAYALSRHPEALKKVRQEYDEVFGPEVWQTAARIKEDPYIINKLPYTVAIVKECLRLWPPASSVRVGGPGQFVHYDGKQYPIEGDWIRRLSVYKLLLIASQVS